MHQIELVIGYPIAAAIVHRDESIRQKLIVNLKPSAVVTHG